MLLIVSHLNKSFGARDVLKDVSLKVHEGETVALLGPNGCGKTTLIRIIMGQDYPDSGEVHLARKIRVGYLSQSLEEIGEGQVFGQAAKALDHIISAQSYLRRLEIAMADPNVAADPDKLDELMSRYARAQERFEEMDGYTWRSRIRSTLLGLGLREDHLYQKASVLSGGERVRLALARLLLSDPDLLILDEPTNHLDLAAVQWLEGFLRSFSGGALVVSHDRFFLDQVADKVVDMTGGSTKTYSGNYSDYLRQKQAQDQEQMHLYEQQQREIRRTKEIVERYSGSKRSRLAKSRAKQLARLEAQAVSAPSTPQQGPRFSVEDPEHVSNLIAEAKNLSKRLPGGRLLFKDVSFRISGGNKVGIIGENGAGKTTLLRILLGHDTDYEGDVRLGKWVDTAYLAQEVSLPRPESSVLDYVRDEVGLSEEDARRFLARYLFTGEEVLKRISSLSGGEQARLAFACLMRRAPDCLILDEPTNHLDIPARECLEDALAEYGGTVIAVSHDRYFLNKVVNKIMEFSNGTVRVFDGNYSAYQRIAAARLRSGENESRAIRAGTRTGAKEKPSFQSRVRKLRHLTAAELEERISEVEEELDQLEQTLQQDDSSKAGHRQLTRYEELTVELNALYEAWGEKTGVS